jgi:hypothetical protein
MSQHLKFSKQTLEKTKCQISHALIFSLKIRPIEVQLKLKFFFGTFYQLGIYVVAHY